MTLGSSPPTPSTGRPTSADSGELQVHPHSRWVRGAGRVVFAGLLLLYVYVYLVSHVTSLDDAYIYLRVARNWLAGVGPVFNAGDTHFPITSPLWLALVTLSKWALPELSLAVLSLCLYLLAQIGAALGLHLLLLERYPVAAALAPLATIAGYPAMAAIGMETALLLALAVALLWAYQRRAWRCWGLLGGLLYLARPDAAVLVATLAGSHVAVRAWPLLRAGWSLSSSEVRAAAMSAARELLPGMALLAVAPLVWHAYFYAEFGQLLPDTLSVKMEQGASGTFGLYLKRIPLYIHLAMWRSIPMYLLAAIGAWTLLRWLPALAAWPVLLSAAYGALFIPAYHWYYAPLTFAGGLSMILGVDRIAHWLLERRPAAALGAPALVWGVIYLHGSAAIPSMRHLEHPERASEVLVRDLRARYEAASARYQIFAHVADWIREQGPPDGATVLVGEVGTLAYLLPELQLRDPVGLASPGVSRSEMKDDALFVRRYEPAYYVLAGRSLETDYMEATLAFGGTGNQKLWYSTVFDVDFARGYNARVYRRRTREELTDPLDIVRVREHTAHP